MTVLTDLDLFTKICEKATAAGYEKVKSTKVIPMFVGQETSFMSGVIDESTLERVDDGVCGFAWVNAFPENKGNTRLGKIERKVLEAAGFRKDVYGKYYIWISDFNQSMQKKEAFAQAYAAVLRENGVNASSGSRMD